MKKQRFLGVLRLSIASVVISCFTLVPVAFSAVPACVDLNVSLKLGLSDKTTGGSVGKLQNFLKSSGYLPTEATGYFGPVTFKAVKDFQAFNKLPTTGLVGPLTRLAIKNISCVPKTSIQNNVPSNSSITNNAGQQASVVQALGSTQSPIIVAPVKTTLPYQAESFNNWTGTWGNVSTTSTGTLILKAKESTSGAEAVFLDSKHWTDYRISVNATVSNGDLTILGRYVDADNFVGCTFSRNEITIIKRVKGVTERLVSTALADLPASAFFAKSLSVAMRVKGKTVGCIALGSNDNLTYTNLDEALLKGGIGVETWFPYNGASVLELRSVQVEAI